MTARETALVALQTLIQQALEPLADDVVLKPRNTPLAERLDVAAGDDSKSVGCLIDGDAQEPTPLLGDPAIYDHVQAAVFELITVHPDSAARDAGMDQALSAVAAALLADPTLGGACDYARPHPPAISNLGEEGVPSGKAAELPIDLLFSSTSPIG